VVKVSDQTGCGNYSSGQWNTFTATCNVETQGGSSYLIDREGGIQIWQGQQVPELVSRNDRTQHWAHSTLDASDYIDPALVLRAMYAQKSTKFRAGTQALPAVRIGIRCRPFPKSNFIG